MGHGMGSASQTAALKAGKGLPKASGVIMTE